MLVEIYQKLGEKCKNEFSRLLLNDPEVYFDGFKLNLVDGSTLYVRYAEKNKYSFIWEGKNTRWGVDTAPLHRGLKTFPNHIHTENGEIKEDHITSPERGLEENLRSVLKYISRLIHPT